MTDLRQAAQMALEALERIDQADNDCDFLNPSQCYQLDAAITALRAALAEQPDVETCEIPPLGWHCTRHAGHEGPCAAVANDDRELVSRAMKRLAEQPAELEPVAQRWQPIEVAPKGRIVLVYYKNSLGNGRTMRARYYLPETLDSDTTESGWADEGWYEESEAYEYLMPLEHDPTHWMPLPAGPDTAPQPAKRVPLTDEEIEDFYFDNFSMGQLKAFARAVIAAYDAKNGITGEPQ